MGLDGILDKFRKDDTEERNQRIDALYRKAGRYAVLRWSPAAHALGVHQKMIYIFHQGYLQDSFLESEPRINELEGYGIPVIDETAGSQYPDEYIRPASNEIILSRVRLGWVR